MSYTEQQFKDLADAANLAQDAGQHGLAARLDVMARKVNAGLAYQGSLKLAEGCPFRPRQIRWQSVPSSLLPLRRAPTGDSSHV